MIAHAASPLDASRFSDEQIKDIARVDRPAAQELLFRKYGERLQFHAITILRDGPEAGDVVQEVFIRSMREFRLFDGEFKMQAWLYRVTRNLCFNIVRDRRRRGGILAGMPKESTALADQVDRVFGGERREEMLAAVSRLSEDHAEILMLRYYEDLSYAEIAERLDIKLGTVMSRLSRARDRLIESLGGAAVLMQAS
jgi:RNA polymerase sigma-70 factor (ECF subfamily)